MTRIAFNGVDFRTGKYLTPPLEVEELARRILQRSDRNLAEEHELRCAFERGFKKRGAHRRPAPDVDPLSLASSGWGIIIPEGTPKEVRVALAPLVEHRRAQASEVHESYFRELTYQRKESKKGFFRRYKLKAGPAHPKNLPYYLLIVGGPETVPHRFQYLLDMQYAVGRLHFDDPEDYATYARSVVDAEGGRCSVRPETCLIPVLNGNDDAMVDAKAGLVEPLRARLAELETPWTVRLVEQADKATLLRHLGGEETPALLLTSSHGLRLDPEDELQRDLQGAIISGSWRGEGHSLDLDEDVVAARDLGADARLHGMIAVIFACYGAGTPDKDNYPSIGWAQNRKMPARPFVSRLAQRLLAHPNGGALAVIGHVDRAWSCSFGTESTGGSPHFESLMQYLLDGYPVGAAMDWMNERFAELSTELADALDSYSEGRQAVEDADRLQLTRLWRANNDARNFVVLGDPAVRLPNGPRYLRTSVGRALRLEDSRKTQPIASLWQRHTGEWLDKVESRGKVDGDPAAILRALRSREDA